MSTSHDIELSGAGLPTLKALLARDGKGSVAWRLDQAPGLSEAARPGAASYFDFPPSQEWVPALTDFGAGCGIYEVDPQRPETWNGYYLSTGCEATKGHIILSPQIQMSYINGVVGAGLDGPHKNKVTWSGSVFEGAGGAIYKWDSANKWWVLWDEHEAAGVISHTVVFGNNLLVQWEGQNYFHIYTDPYDNTAVSHNTVFNAAVYRFVVLRKVVYCFVGANNQVYANEDATETTLTNWLSLTAGDISYDVNEAFAERDIVWVFKDDGLYALHAYSTGGEAECIVSLKTAPSDNNGRIFTTWGNWIVAGVSQDSMNLMAYNMETGEVRMDWHPRYRFPKTPQLHGSVHGLTSAPGTPLYMVVGNPGYPGYGYYLLEVTERDRRLVYHTKGGHADRPDVIVVEWMAGLNRSILWWFFQSSPYAPGYFRFTDGRNPEDDNTYLFDTGADDYLISSWLPGNFVDMPKALFYWKAECERMVASQQFATLYYQIDNAQDSSPWVSLGTVSTNGWSDDANFPASLSCKRIRFKIVLTTTSSGKTPLFRKLAPHGRAMPLTQELIRCTLTCGGEGRRAAEGQRRAFYSFRDKDEALTLTNVNLKDSTGEPESWVGTIMRESVSESMRDTPNGIVTDISFAFLGATATVAAGNGIA